MLSLASGVFLRSHLYSQSTCSALINLITWKWLCQVLLLFCTCWKLALSTGRPHYCCPPPSPWSVPSHPLECYSEVPLRGWLMHSSQVGGMFQSLTGWAGTPPGLSSHLQRGLCSAPVGEILPDSSAGAGAAADPRKHVRRVKDASSHLGTAARPGHGLSPGLP